MDKETFSAKIQAMLLAPDPGATKEWLDYSDDLEQDGICDAADFRHVVCEELGVIQKEFGQEIADTLYNGGKEFTFNPFELRGAAELLKEGLSLKEVIDKAREGLCDGDGPVPQRPKKQKNRESTR